MLELKEAFRASFELVDEETEKINLTRLRNKVRYCLAGRCSKRTWQCSGSAIVCFQAAFMLEDALSRTLTT